MIAERKSLLGIRELEPEEIQKGEADPAYVGHLPDGLDFAPAAPVLCAGVTVYKGLKECDLRPGQSVVISGIGCSSRSPGYLDFNTLHTTHGRALAFATGRTWMRVPETMRIEYHGELQPWVDGKDLILYTIGKISVSGARYMSIEFVGPAIASLSMDGRFTMANMAIEAGGKAGLFEVDETTLAYVDGRTERPYQIFSADPDANYAQVIEIDAIKNRPV